LTDLAGRCITERVPRGIHQRRPVLLAAVCAGALALVASPRARAACTVNAGAAVAFGTYDPAAAAPTDSAGTITYTCTTAAIVTLSTGGSGTYIPRALASGVNTLSYNLYADAARTQVWGDFSAGTTIRFAAAGANSVLSVFGRIPAAQNPNPGSYADTIVITFFF
jgi:spore coat protein U-like protein